MIKNIIKKSQIRFFWITLERFPNLFRPSSKPYLSGDTLRNFSDHIFDESKTIEPKNIKDKDIVFVNTDVIDIFFDTVFQEIKNDFILNSIEIVKCLFIFYQLKIIFLMVYKK